MTQNHEFTTWLEAATRDLPAEVAASTRQELTAHYEDALEEYVESGLPLSVAHQRAMTDLGAASVTSNGLNDVHRGQKHYLWGMLASAAILVILIGRGVLHEAFGIEPYSTESDLFIGTSDVLLTLVTAYILLMLGRVMVWRFNQPSMNRTIQLIIGGHVIAIACDALYRSAIADEMYAGSALSAFNADTLSAALVIACSALSRLVMGLGIVVLGRRVLEAAPGLYGLGKALAVLLFVMGGTLASIGLWTHLGFELATYTADIVIIFAHLLLWNLMVLLFFRLAYRSPLHPTRFA